MRMRKNKVTMIPTIEGHTHLKAEAGYNKENNENYFIFSYKIYTEVGV